MITVYISRDKFTATPDYRWKCTDTAFCDNFGSAAIIGWTGHINGLIGSGICVKCFPQFIRNKTRVLYSLRFGNELFIPYTLPENVRTSVIKLLNVIFSSEGGVNIVWL